MKAISYLLKLFLLFVALYYFGQAIPEIKYTILSYSSLHVPSYALRLVVKPNTSPSLPLRSLVSSIKQNIKFFEKTQHIPTLKVNSFMDGYAVIDIFIPSSISYFKLISLFSYLDSFSSPGYLIYLTGLSYWTFDYHTQLLTYVPLIAILLLIFIYLLGFPLIRILLISLSSSIFTLAIFYLLDYEINVSVFYLPLISLLISLGYILSKEYRLYFLLGLTAISIGIVYLLSYYHLAGFANLFILVAINSIVLLFHPQPMVFKIRNTRYSLVVALITVIATSIVLYLMPSPTIIPDVYYNPFPTYTFLENGLTESMFLKDYLRLESIINVIGILLLLIFPLRYFLRRKINTSLVVLSVITAVSLVILGGGIGLLLVYMILMLI